MDKNTQTGVENRRIPLSEVGNRMWCSLDGEVFLARVAIDENGVFLERVVTRDAARSQNRK